MKPVRSAPRAVLLSLALAVLMAGSSAFVAAVAGYVMGPPRAEPDPAILVLVAALTLGPSILLGLATRRVRLVALAWDLGKTGGTVLVFVSALLAIFLAITGLYPVVRLVQMLAP